MAPGPVALGLRSCVRAELERDRLGAASPWPEGGGATRPARVPVLGADEAGT
jgi:hypothetical protein